ncbi:MAG: cobalamin biosynthesis protein CobD [Chloroflexi bacterium RBG_16_60_22]|nr:MAG: cobalamin biosynthesis protein CobD [Chloroflexi bacterium RBG_16_60_22]
MEILIILALAVAIDLALGDPPNAFHPVAWMGKVISLLSKIGLKLNPAGQFIWGMVITLFTVALFTVPLYFIFLYVGRFSLVAGTVLAALLLKSTFSMRGLRRAALKVKRGLEEEKSDEARRELSSSLVSRDTDLPRPLMVSAAVESVAEGTGDSLVAPLFYFMLLGLPGAIAYRVVNTLDAMIGYHGRYEYLGKFAARLDDALNFIPARLAALALVLAAALNRNGRRAWRTAVKEHSKTESPNAGWPMAAMAGALDVRLEKVGHYRLGEGNAPLVPETIADAVKLMLLAAAAWILVCFIAGGIRFAVTP